MKLISFFARDKERVGLLVNDHVYELSRLYPGWPVNMQELLENWERWFKQLQKMNISLHEKHRVYFPNNHISELRILAPVTKPGSCRDGYAFRQHVEAARRNRGLPMIPEFDQYPIFYYTNHRTIQGPGNVYCMPDHFMQLDFELEVAIVIGKEGKNIMAKDADTYIAGLMIMNDISARTLQMEEMLLNLGPAKGKDFSTVIGPWLVTLDELSDKEVPCKLNHVGKTWDLTMKAFVNGVQVSSGNVKEMDWTFAEIIERASYGVTLYPGDVIGSGTVGTGCFLELNGTARLLDPSFIPQWLKEGDQVHLVAERLGMLSNTMTKTPCEHSILNKKKTAQQ